MTETPTTKTEWLEQIEAAAAGWDALLAEVGEARMGRPVAAGDWTIKDVVAHLNAWRVRTVDRLEAASRGEAPPPPPWPAGLDDDTDEGTDEINRWFYERDRNRPAAELIAESREQYRRMRAAVEAVPEADLFEPGRFAWLGGPPLSAVLDGSFEHLLVDREPEIRAWLARERSSSQPAGD